MLKVEHPTDYLKKEEIVKPIEEQHIEQVGEFPTLKRYRRSDSPDYDDNDQTRYSEDLIRIVRGNDSEEEKIRKIKDLIDSGADVNFKDAHRGNNTPLHAAVRKKEREVIKLLLEKGAEIDIENNEGKTPLDLAKDPEIISTLEKYYKLSLNEGLFTKINVPADGNCLFWAATLAYLTPVKHDDNTFRERFERLFGSIQSQELAQVQNLIKAYNPSSGSVAIRNDEALKKLVTEKFRNRVIDEISSHQSQFDESITINDFLHSKNEDYVIGGTFQEKFRNEFNTEISQYNIDVNKFKPDTLNEGAIQTIDNELDKIQDQNKVKKFKFETYVECMRDSKAWGSNHEIQAMSKILHSNILVFSDGTKYSISYDNSNDQVQLFNNGEFHYNFGLVKAPTLIEAIKSNKQYDAKTYLNLGMDNINYKDSEGWTALHFAAQHGNTEIIQSLLAQGAATNIKNNLNQTPIQAAISQVSEVNELNNHMEIAVSLLDKEAPEYNLSDNEKKILLDYITKYHPEVTRDNPSIQLKLQLSTSGQVNNPVEQLQSSLTQHHKFKKNKSNRGGTDYESVLSMLFLKRAVENQYKFELATERTEDEKFDDLCFQYNDDTIEKKVYLLQAKYTDDVSSKITYDHIKTQSDAKFSLPKYFNSYRKIKKKEEFKKDLENLGLIISTTIHFDSDDSGKIKNSESIEVVEIKENDGIFKKDNKELGKRYKLKINTSAQKQDVFKDTYSSLREMAKKLVECTLENKLVDMNQLPIIHRYHIALGKEVIDVGNKKFYSKFLDIQLDNQDGLSENAKEFQKIFYESAREFLKEKKDSLEKLHIRERQNTEKILSDFSEIVDKGLNDETAKGAFWKKLESKQLTLPQDFGKFKIKKDDKKSPRFIDNLINIIKNLQSINIPTSKRTNFEKNINKLGGYIFIIKDNIVKFNEEFLKSEKLPESLKEFRNQLYDMLGEKDFAKLNECELTFNFENQDDAKNFQEKVYWNLKDDNLKSDIIDSEVDEFLGKLLFVVTPKVDAIKKAIKDEIEEEFGSKNGENIYNTLNTKILDWIDYRDQEGNGYYFSNKNNAYDESKKQFLGPIRFNVKGPVKLFTGREEKLGELHEALYHNQGQAIISQKASISGLGGIGKTELARQYIVKHARDYDSNIIWVDAETQESLKKSFQRLAQELKIPTIENKRESTDSFTGISEEYGIQAVELQNETKEQERNIKLVIEDIYKHFKNIKSLFIFDNADGYNSIKEFVPSSLSVDDKKPYILITSRNQKWGDMKVVPLSTFTEKEATDFIREALNIKDLSQENEIKNLADTLQHFPLALQQAVAYVKERDVALKNVDSKFEISDYLRRYEEETKKLLDFKFPEDSSDSYTKTTFTTWRITTDKIKDNPEHGKQAAEILNIIAYFAHDNIPAGMFLGLELVNDNREKLGEAIQLLKKYSMIDSEEEQSSVNIHRLVQQVTRINLKEQNKEEEVLRKALRLFQNNINLNNLDHVISVWNYASKCDKLVKEFCDLPHNIISKLESNMKYEEAILFGKHAAELLESKLGPDHPSTLTTKNNMAIALSSQGRYDEALQIYQKVLDIQNRPDVLGPYNRYTLITKRNIAAVFLQQGKYNEALQTLQEILDIQEAFELMLEDSHPDILQTKNQIAVILLKQGKYDEALKALQEIYEESKKAFGPDNHKTLDIKGNIATTLKRQGKYSKALQIYHEVLATQQKTSGSDDQYTLTIKHNIAGVLLEQGKYDDALKTFQEVLDIQQKTLRSDNPSILSTKHGIGGVLLKQGKYDEALKAFQEVFDKRKAILGEDHPDTLTVKHSMAGALRNQGKYEKILQDYQEVFDKRKEILGLDHPDTLGARCSIARVLKDQGKYDKALQALQEVFDTRKAILGENHPDTLSVKYSMAKVLYSQGKYNEALQVFQEVFDIQKKPDVLGPDNPNTLATKHGMALMLLKQGKYGEALQILQEVFNTQRRPDILGPDNSDTLTTKHNIALVLLKQGKYNEALQTFREVLDIQKSTGLGSDSPDILDVKHSIAVVLLEQGKYNEALQAFQEVLDIQKRPDVLGPDNPSTLATKHNIAEVLSKQGRYDEALAINQEVLDKYKQTFGPNHPDTLIIRNAINTVMLSKGIYEEALKNYQEVFEKQQEILGPDHLETLKARGHIASVFFRQGKYDEALKIDQEILNKYKQMLGTSHPTILAAMHSIAAIFSKQEKYKEALEIYQEVFDKQKEALGTDHPDTLNTENSIAGVLDNQAKHDEALVIYREVLNKYNRVLGANHPSTLITKHNIAYVLNHQDKHDEALKIYQEIFEKQKETLGYNNYDTLRTESNIAGVLEDQGKYNEALTAYQKVLEKYKQVFGASNPDTLTTMHNTGYVLYKQGKYDEALKIYEEVKSQREQVFGPDHPDTLNSISNIANLLDEQGKHDEALVAYHDYVSKSKRRFGLNYPNTLIIMGHIAGVLLKQGKYDEALKVYQETFEKQKKVFGPENLHTLTIRNNMATILEKQGKYDEALRIYQEVLEKFKQVLSPDHIDTLAVKYNIATTSFKQEKYDIALKIYQEVLDKYKKNLDIDDPRILTVMHNIAEVFDKQGKFDEALKAFKKVSEKRRQILGPDHTDTLNSIYNVAKVLYMQDKYEEALKIYHNVLGKYEQMFGLDYPNTLIVKSHIAEALFKQGKYNDVLKICQEILEKQKEILGPYHEDTMMTQYVMTQSLVAQGRYDEALKIYQEVFEKQKKILGSDHPDTLMIKQIAAALSKQGKSWTMLHLATSYGSEEEVKYLLNEGYDINAITKDGFTPLHLAIKNNNKKTVNALIEYSKNRSPQQLSNLINSRTNLGKRTSLHIAAQDGNKEIVEILLKNGANYNAKDTQGKAPLDLAKSGSDIKNLLSCIDVLFKAVQDGKKDEFDSLLVGKDDNTLRAILHAQNSDKKTLVQIAITSNHRNIAELLIKKLKSNIGKVYYQEKQQKAFVRLGRYLDNQLPETEVKAVKQRLYLPSFESRNIQINGKCAAITRVFSQELFLEQQGETLNHDRKPHELFLQNLQTSAELYERIAQGKQISSREEKEIFALSRLLDGAESELNSPTSSLPSHLSHVKSYKTLADLSQYLRGLSGGLDNDGFDLDVDELDSNRLDGDELNDDKLGGNNDRSNNNHRSGDFAIHLVTNNHVVAIYRTGGTYTYFDSNVALVSGLKTVDQLMKVVEKGVKYAGYELAEEGFLVEHFDVSKANKALTTVQKEVLTKPIQTERHLLSLQDQEHGLIDVDGEKISRVTLYDMGAKLHSDGSAPILINSGMSSEDLTQNLSSGKIKITAREYLQKLKDNKKEVVQDLVQKISSLPFLGSINEVKDAKTIQDLVLSEDGQRLNSYELNKILKGPIEQSIKALPYYLEVANTKHWPNRLTNAAGRISMAKGLYDVAHSIRYGDTEGFLLGSGEIGFSLFSQLIEDGIVKVTPQFIKQMKHGIFLSRGFAGMISSPFDIYDLIRSSIDLAKAEKGSKEWRDSIAGVVLSGTSVTTSIAFTALGKPGVGTVVGLGIIIGQGFYSGTSMVIEYKKYKLTTNQEFRLFWNTFALQLPPEDVQYLAARQDVVNGLAEQAWEYLQNNTQVTAYAMGLGEISFKDNDLARVKRMVVDIEQSMTGARVRHNVYVPEHNDLEEAIKDIIPKPKTVVVNPSSASIGMNNPSNEREGKNLSRIVPVSPSPEAQMLCLPEFTHRDYEYDHEKPMYSNSSTAIYNCRNAMIVGRKHDIRENPVMVFDLNLVNGTGLIVSSSQYRNQFNIAQGGTRIYGSNHTSNVFTLTNDNFFGTVIGGITNATNVLDVSQLKSEGLSYKNDIITTQEAQTTAENINHFIGRNSADEHVDCQNMNKKMIVDSRGGNSRNSDVISNCKQVVVTGNTKVVSNESDNTFYIRPSNGYAEIKGAGKGFIIFSDTALLEKASDVSYSVTNNTLSLQINLQEDNGKNNGTFTLDINNYLGRENNHNYVLIDKYGSVIEPLIQPNSTEVTNFNLKTETNLTTNAEIAERYKEISQTNNNYTVYGVIRDLAERYTIFGSNDSDVIPLTKNVTFAQGNEEGDVYSLMPNEQVNVTINNYDENKAIDMLYLPMNVTLAEAEKVENDLHISIGNATINVENYFGNSSYRHLTVIDKDKNTFLPWSNNQSYVQLVPFFHATKDQYIFLLSAKKVRNNPEVIIDANLEDTRFYRDGNDLMLMDDKPLIVKVENFYGSQYGNFTLNFRNQDKLSSKQLFELAKLAINYQDEIRSTYYESVREYVNPSNSSTIHHNQKFINGSFTTVEPDNKRVGILVLQDPSDIEVSANNNDLVFFVAQSNATFVIKNWNDTDHRISMLKFGNEDKSIEVRGLDKFDLSEISEIQSLIDKAAISNAVDEQLEELDNEVVNGLKYLLASNGIVMDVHNCLGFDSIEDQQEFVAAYSTFYSKDKLQQVLQDSQTVEVLRWLIAKGHINLSLKNPDKERNLLIEDLDQCFGAKDNFTIKNGNDRVFVLKFNQSIEVDLPEVSEIQYLIGKYGISNTADQQLEKLGNEVVNNFKYLLVSIDIKNGIDVYNCLAEKDTQKILNPYYYEWVNWDLVKYLIENKEIDVNAKANDGNTLLHEAASSGNLSIVQYLIDEKKVDVNTKANDSRTPLHHAAASGSLNLVKYLVDEKGVNVNTKDNDGKTSLHYAAYSGNLDLVKYLEKSVDINTKDNDGNTILLDAVSSDNLDLVKYLIEEGADVNTKTQGHWTPLHKAAEKGNEEIVLALLEKGVDVNARTNGGYTALHWAALSGNKETVLALLDNSANVNAKIDSGETPLHLAASKGNKEAVLALLNKGADVNAKDDSGWTPLRTAEQHGKGEIVVLLSSTRRESSEVNQTTIHRIRHRHEHQNTTTHQRSRRALNEESIASSATRVGSRINDLFGWVKSSIGGLFNSRAIESEKTASSKANGLPRISQVYAQVDVNGTIMLLDLLIRKVTGQKFTYSTDQSISLLEAQGYALNITTKFEQVLNETAFKSGISATNLNFNPVTAQSTIVGYIRNGNFSEISKTLYLSAEKACPEFKQTDKFLARLKNNLEEVVAEKEVELLVGKQKGLSKGISNNKLVEKSVPQANVDNKPNTFLNGTSIVKGIGNVLGL